MQQTTPSVNTGIAPLTNVALCLGTLKRAINRPRHLPGITVFYGPSGFGKSTAAACAVIQCRACYVQARSSWTKKAAHEAICKGLGLKPGRTLSEMLDQIAEELALSGKPLVIDEADFLVEHNQIEIVRDIYEASQAPIMLIGEEWLPGKLEKWERFHGRVLDWCPAQPVSFEDVTALCRLYAAGTEIADDLLQRIYTASNGSARRVVVNLALVEEAAKVEGRKTISLDDWGARALYTGEAPSRRR